MIRLLATAVILAASASASAAAYAQHAHEHGAARLEVALDGGKLSIGLESPLDNLVGFEHAPRNEKQRAALAKMTDDLKGTERLFDLPAAAACEPVRAESTHPHGASQAAKPPHSMASMVTRMPMRSCRRPGSSPVPGRRRSGASRCACSTSSAASGASRPRP